MFNNISYKGHIDGVAAYYKPEEAMHILQFQFHYDKTLKSNKRYQVVTFKFIDKQELERFIRDFKSSFGIKHISELRSKDTDFSFYIDRDEKLVSTAELSFVSIGKNYWYPAGVGISGEFKEAQMIFSCD